MPRTRILSLPLGKLRLDGGTQQREEIDEETAGEYALAYQAGKKLPPVQAVQEGKDYWLWDGFTRHRGHEIAGLKQIMVEVRPGTQRDAVLLSVGANAEHGKRRTNADKRRAVLVLLKDKEWSKWTNRKIAEQCGVDEGLVRKIKRELVGNADNPQPCEVDNSDEAAVDALPPDLAAAFHALDPEQRKALLQLAKDEATENRVNAALRERDKANPAQRLAGIERDLDSAARRIRAEPDIAESALEHLELCRVQCQFALAG